MAVDSQSLWLKFLYELSSKVAGANPDVGVQTLYPFQMWDWGGTEYPLDSIPYAQQIFLDRVPLAPVGNFLPAPANFSSNYLQFISQLDTQDDSDPKIKDLYQKLVDAEASQSKLMKEATSAWLNDKTKPADQSFTDWLKGNATYSRKLEQADLDVTAAQDNYNEYRGAKFEDIKRATDRYNNNLLYITNQGGQQVQVAPWFTSDNPYALVEKITGNNFGGDATKGQAFKFSLDSSTQEYDYERIWGKASTGLDLGFFSIYADGKFEQVSLSTMSSNWTIDFSFQSFDPITIGVPDWYDSGVVQGRRNGPFRTGFTGYKDSGKPKDVWFFGDGGLLGRMSTVMWVGYRPTVTIRAGKSVYDYVKKKIDAGGGLQIGPFRFSASGSSETVSTFEFNSSLEITASAKADWPYIICDTALPTVPSAALNQRMLTTRRATASGGQPRAAVAARQP